MATYIEDVGNYDLADVEDVEGDDLGDLEDVEGDDLGDLEDVGDVADVADVLDLVSGDELGDVGRFRLRGMLRKLDPRVVLRARKMLRRRRKARRQPQQAVVLSRGGGERRIVRMKREEILLPFEPTIGVFQNGLNSVIFRARVQRRFQPQRLIIDLARIGPTSNGLIVLDDLIIGTEPQAAAIGGFPASAFGPTAVATRLSLRVVDPAIDVILRIRVEPAPNRPGGDGEEPDRILLNVGFIGPAA